MRGCTIILEGKIFSARISLALERSIGGCLLHISDHIQPSPYILVLCCSCYPTTPTFMHIFHFHIYCSQSFQGFLYHCCIVIFRIWELAPPHFLSWYFHIIVFSFFMLQCLHINCADIGLCKLCVAVFSNFIYMFCWGSHCLAWVIDSSKHCTLLLRYYTLVGYLHLHVLRLIIIMLSFHCMFIHCCSPFTGHFLKTTRCGKSM